MNKANFYSIAISNSKNSFFPHIQQLLMNEGIGIITVLERTYYSELTVIERQEPKLFRVNPHFSILKSLNEDQKKYNAGTSSGFSTPFSRTMDGVLKIIKENPGINLTQLFKKLDTNHHYQTPGTAKACLTKMLKLPKFNIEIKSVGNQKLLYIK